MNVKSGDHLKEAGQARPFWANVLSFPQFSDGHLAGVINMLAVQKSDIFTGKLPYTKSFFAGNGNVSILRAVPQPFTLQDAMGLLCLMGTHSRLARYPGVHLNGLSVWVRVEGNDGVARRVPAMTAASLALMADLDVLALKAILSPMMRDGAIRVVAYVNGGVGFALMPGFINDQEVARHLIS